MSNLNIAEMILAQLKLKNDFKGSNKTEEEYVKDMFICKEYCANCSSIIDKKFWKKVGILKSTKYALKCPICNTRKDYNTTDNILVNKALLDELNSLVDTIIQLVIEESHNDKIESIVYIEAEDSDWNGFIIRQPNSPVLFVDEYITNAHKFICEDNEMELLCRVNLDIPPQYKA